MNHKSEAQGACICLVCYAYATIVNILMLMFMIMLIGHKCEPACKGTVTSIHFTLAQWLLVQNIRHKRVSPFILFLISLLINLKYETDNLVEVELEACLPSAESYVAIFSFPLIAFRQGDIPNT